jgi:hypothetical protein
VPDIVAKVFEKLMIYVYKEEVCLLSRSTESAIGLYYAGLYFYFENAIIKRSNICLSIRVKIDKYFLINSESRYDILEIKTKPIT